MQLPCVPNTLLSPHSFKIETLKFSCRAYFSILLFEHTSRNILYLKTHMQHKRLIVVYCLFCIVSRGSSRNWEFKKLWLVLQRKYHFEMVLPCRLSVLWLFDVRHCVRRCNRSVLLLDWNERFSHRGREWKNICCGSRCPANHEFETFTLSFGRLRQKKRAARFFFPHSTNHSSDLWRCRSRHGSSVFLINRTCRLIRHLTQLSCWPHWLQKFAVERHSPPHELQNILGNLSE